MSDSFEKYVVGIVGVGNMGGGMARNLLARGWPVQVHDIDASRARFISSLGASNCASPAQAAAKSVAVIVCVIDAAQTREVLFGAKGIAAAMPLGSTVVLCPTLAPESVEEFAAELRQSGLHTIDAPMSGGPARAADGSMSLMVACEPNVFVRHKALLDVLSNRLFHVGDRVGDGARTKLVNNLAGGINLVAAAEVMVMAHKMGLDLARTLDVIEQSSGQSWVGSDRMRRAIADDYAPRAHMTLLEKDTRLAVEMARAAGCEGPLGAAASRVFADASAGGLRGEDDAALFKWLGRARPG